MEFSRLTGNWLSIVFVDYYPVLGKPVKNVNSN